MRPAIILAILLSAFLLPPSAFATSPRSAAAVGLAYAAVTGQVAVHQETDPHQAAESQAAAGQEKIYFFTADWCPACPAAKLLANELHRRGFPVYVVDCDQRRDLVAKYLVRGIPEFVAVRDGELIGRRRPAKDTTAENLARSFALLGFYPRENKAQASQPAKTVTIHATDYDRAIESSSPACTGGNCYPPTQTIRLRRR